MGGTSSRSYECNTSEVNASISNIRNQLTSVSININNFKKDIDVHINSVQNKFNIINNKVLVIQNEFVNTFGILDSGIRLIKENINSMSNLQIEYEKNTKSELWAICQNDWKQEFLSESNLKLQNLINFRNKLELNLNKKINMYLLEKDKFNDLLLTYQYNKILQIQQIQQIQQKQFAQIEYIMRKQFNLVDSTNSTNLTNSDNSLSYGYELFFANNTKCHELIRKENDFEIDTNLEIKSIDTIEKFVEFKKNFMPVLSDDIKYLINDLDQFEEITIEENLLFESVQTTIVNFFKSANLINPLDDEEIEPIELARKIFNSGIHSFGDMVIQNQDKILISNGFGYIPNYKYPKLILKYIKGLYLLSDSDKYVQPLQSSQYVQSIQLVLENFYESLNLINPLDDNKIKPIDLVKKIFDFGTILQNYININNQDEILISNGFRYVSDKKLTYKCIKGLNELINLEKIYNRDNLPNQLVKSAKLVLEIFYKSLSLIDPLDDNKIEPKLLAKKIFKSGISSLSEINIYNQDRILISNGFKYISENNYEKLVFKFIKGLNKLNQKNLSSSKYKFEKNNLSIFENDIKIMSYYFTKIILLNRNGKFYDYITPYHITLTPQENFNKKKVLYEFSSRFSLDKLIDYYYFVSRYLSIYNCNCKYLSMIIFLNMPKFRIDKKIISVGCVYHFEENLNLLLTIFEIINVRGLGDITIDLLKKININLHFPNDEIGLDIFKNHLCRKDLLI